MIKKWDRHTTAGNKKISEAFARKRAELPIQERTCLTCGKVFKRKKYKNGHWQRYSTFSKQKYCTPSCYFYSKQLYNRLMKYKFGSDNPMWKGGVIKHPTGYCLVSQPQHPQCNATGYVKRGRLVMEKYLGRFLTRKEVVHHINGKKDDDRIENLRLFASNGEHVRFHNLNTKIYKKKR